MKIIIPSATVVNGALQDVGKIPSIIYPINQRTVFDYLYEKYGDADYSIIIYENAESVKEKLIKYKGVELIQLTHLGTLGYTILNGLKGVHGDGVINFGDTIVFDDLDDLKEDSFYYAEDLLSKEWTFFSDKNGMLTQIMDKNTASNNVSGKLFVGVFRFSHIEYLSECLEKVISETEESSLINPFYIAVQKYSYRYPLTPILAKDWMDIGHADKYFNSQLEVKAREFNHIKIDKNRGLLTKYSDDVDKFIGEIKWYLKIPNDLEYARPRIFDYSLDYTKPYVTMEYYAYHTVHEYYLYGDLDEKQWRKIFSRINFVCHDFQRYVVKDEGIISAEEEMYLTKTKERINKLRHDNRFISFFRQPIYVNGTRYKPLSEIELSLEKIIPDKLYDLDYFTIIHGDLCFANIMIDSNFNFIKVIDPRGKFGSYDIYGDPRYELAKLFHSVDGKYDYIIKGLFELDYDTDKPFINYSIKEQQKNIEIYNAFMDVFEDEIGHNKNQIELIEALLFLSMIPLHNESFEQQMVMLATGLEIFNRVENITK